MRTFAIGDIHGCLFSLQTLLDCLEIQSDDRLIFLGDYIDRGPDSRGVLDKLIELSANPRHVFLRGNHDDWLLEARKNLGWFKNWVGEGVGGKATLESYGARSFKWQDLEGIPAAHWEFLNLTRLYFESDYEIFVHASISWQDPAENDARTLMWRSVWDIEAHPSGKRVICGHTSQPNGLPLDRDFAVCIDTFCGGYQGWLCALDVQANRVFQANQSGEVRQFGLGEIPV